MMNFLLTLTIVQIQLLETTTSNAGEEDMSEVGNLERCPVLNDMHFCTRL